jgi:hypothetical protein
VRQCRADALDQTPKLYATTLRGKNTNAFGMYASAAQVEFVEGILAPGDMLFIPKSHWHYVRSLTTSCSINFWFD